MTQPKLTVVRNYPGLHLLELVQGNAVPPSKSERKVAET